MKKVILFGILAHLLAGPFKSSAQEFTGSEKEVYEAIIQLFDGMRAGDSAMVREVFREDARMFSNFKDETGALKVTEGSLKSFLNAIGTPHNEVWNEIIWNTKINVEMGVAQVWTDYAFYRGNQFSHCGIDAFQLVFEDRWKIVQIIDTRRKENCSPPGKQ